MFVMQGSGGGIGRLEVLLTEMMRVLQDDDRIEFMAISREPHPEYLHQRAGSNESRRMGKLAFSFHVLRQFLSWKPDVVILSHVNQVPLGLAMRLARRRVRQVVMVYGWDVWFGVTFLRRLALRQIDRAWSISQYTADKVSETTGYPASRIKLLVPVLTPAEANLLATEVAADPSPTTKPRLLSIARLDATERQKGIDHVLRAIHILRRDYPELTYTIVGDGGDRQRLEAIARSLGIDERVTFAGWQNHFDLPEMYRACDLFVLPSAQEGFGLVFLEAMAAGRAVVATHAGAIPEVVVDRETGWLVDYGDVEGLASAIARLSSDAALRRRMGHAGRNRFLEHFSFEGATDRLAELLQDLA